MAASYPPAPASIIKSPLTLPTYSTLNFNPVPFVPSKNLDFSKHKNMLKMLGLWDFTQIEFDTGVRMDLIAELIASYDPKFQCSYVHGTRITVNRADLAKAMKLHLKKSDVVSLDLKEDSMEFIIDFLLNWVLLHGDTWLFPSEVLNWVKMIKDGHPEKLDWAGLLWFMVENELNQGVKLENCYYASHLQCLIKSQCEDVFLEEEAEKMELNDLRKTHIEEMKKKDEEILRLECELSDNKKLVERYKEAWEEMHNVVKECKKIFEIPKEAKSECKKKFLGISKQSCGHTWRSHIQSAKIKAKQIYLGNYPNAEAAARAYDVASLWINGSKAKLNFPKSSSIAYLPPPDTVMSPEIIQRVAASAAKTLH